MDSPETRRIQVNDTDACGFLPVAMDDVILPGGGYAAGFARRGRFYYFHSIDPCRSGRVLYADATPE